MPACPLEILITFYFILFFRALTFRYVVKVTSSDVFFNNSLAFRREKIIIFFFKIKKTDPSENGPLDWNEPIKKMEPLEVSPKQCPVQSPDWPGKAIESNRRAAEHQDRRQIPFCGLSLVSHSEF